MKLAIFTLVCSVLIFFMTLQGLMKCERESNGWKCQYGIIIHGPVKYPDTIFYPPVYRYDMAPGEIERYIKDHTDSWQQIIRQDTVLIESFCNCDYI